MRKALFIACLLVLGAGNALALDMEARSFYAQGILSLPTGDFGDVAGTGFGGGVGVLVPHDAQLNFRGEIGFLFFGGQTFGDLDYSYSMIPVVALAEYTFQPGGPFYGLGGLGLFVSRFSVDGSAGGISFDDSDSSTDFGVTLGAGYRLNEQFSVEGRFNLISDANQATVSGVYHF